LLGLCNKASFSIPLPFIFISILFLLLYAVFKEQPSEHEVSEDQTVIKASIDHRMNAYAFSLERRWSSRTFRYGYLVTTSPQSSIPP